MQSAIHRPQHRGVLAAVLAAEALLAAGLVGWYVIGEARGGYALLAAAALGLLGSVPTIRARCRTRWRRMQFALRRARRDPREVLAPAFDVPLSATRSLGARWVDDTLITMIALDGDATASTTLTPTGIVDRSAGEVVDPILIANCLNTFDITVDSVDLICHGQRMAGPPHLAAIYHHTLGPLPAVANLTAFLVIRLRPTRCAAAISRRGGGSLGAVRSATVTTRRIASALHDAGLTATILDAGQLRDATGFLADGVPVSDVVETWSDLNHGATRVRTFGIAAAALPRVAAADGWTHAALSTTLTIRFRPGPAGVDHAGLLRVIEAPASNRVLAEPVAGLNPLAGRQREAFCATLPVGSAALLDRVLDWAPVGHRGPHVPVRGCGQLIGADADGHAVALPLAGAPTVVAAGEQLWVWQLVIRAIATGERVKISTDRPEYWRPLIDIVGDADAIDLDDASSRRGTPTSMYVIDRPNTSPDPAGANPRPTRLYIVDDSTRRPDETTLMLMQDRSASGFVDVELGTRRIRMSIVATPDEGRLLGGGRQIDATVIGGQPPSQSVCATPVDCPPSVHAGEFLAQT